MAVRRIPETPLAMTVVQYRYHSHHFFFFEYVLAIKKKMVELCRFQTFF